MTELHPENLKPFKKNDPRINRAGRPKSFDALRKLAQQLVNETAKDKEGKPIIRDGHTVTQVEALLLKMMHDDPQRFVEIAFGKVPQPVEHTGKDGEKLEIVVRYADDSKPPPSA